MDDHNTTQMLPNIVYYNDDHKQSTKCTDSISAVIGCTWTLPGTWEELTREIEHGAEFLAFHIDMIDKSGLTAAEFISAIHTIGRFCKCSRGPIKIMIIIAPHTPLARVKEIQRLPVSGLGLELYYYAVEEVSRCCQELVAGNSYWPKHIISKLPGAPAKKTSANKSTIQLTPRQQQVFDLIKSRGLSNKQIARALAISENTVKMYVGDIMRAYGVKNRTQLAVLG